VRSSHEVVKLDGLGQIAIYFRGGSSPAGGPRRLGIGGVLVDRDDPWGGRMLCPESIAEKALGGLGIAGCTQQKVNGMALSIDSPVEVIPRVLDVDAGLIEPVRIMSSCEIWPTAFVELGRIALDPAEYRRMIDAEAALQLQFFNVTIAQGITERSSHPTSNDRGSKVAPFA